jgi:kynureninase
MSSPFLKVPTTTEWSISAVTRLDFNPRVFASSSRISWTSGTSKPWRDTLLVLPACQLTVVMFGGLTRCCFSPVEPTPWMDIDTIVTDSMATLVGAQPKEVVMMNSLTCNLHMMMTAFYRPNETRFKILIEKKAFPSDTHAVISQIQLHNLDPKAALIEVAPRAGEITLRLEDIEEVIAREGQSIALVMFSGVQYYTGQLFDMQRITAAAQAQGCKVGWDLAHAVGNVPLRLHDWGCDFACWCTYKYMNCGPGSIGGCFVHERHGNSGARPEVQNQARDGTIVAPEPLRMAGWWGHRRDDRFAMEPQFIPAEGVNGFRLSNPPVLLMSCVRASLDLYDKVRALGFTAVICTPVRC